MNDRNTRIILSTNIKVDKNYKNVLSYTTEEMLKLMEDKDHLVYEANNTSFAKPDQNYFNIAITYGKALRCNYLAFTNPDYSNKWFFAFIDNIEYMSDNVTKIYFKIDSWMTFIHDVDVKESYVIREHVSDDTIGKNTYPEGIETGSYTCNNDVVKFGIGNCHAVICLTEEPFEKGRGSHVTQMNGIPSGLWYYVSKDMLPGNSFIGYCINYAITQKDPSMIQSIILVPDSMLGDMNQEGYWDSPSEGGFKYDLYHELNEMTTEAIDMGMFTIDKNYNNINGYIPKNNKLFCYPYQYIVVDNNCGSCYEYKMEDFKNDNIEFNVKGVITPGCSIRAIPQNYQNITNNNASGINAGKLPVGSWSSDPYINWLTQNGVNMGMLSSIKHGVASIMPNNNIEEFGKIIGSSMGMVNKFSGILPSHPVVSAGLSVGNAMHDVYEHSRVPVQVHGNTNSGDVTYSTGNSTFSLYYKTIKKEYAEKIDEYFSRFGYKVCELKKPNLTTRKSFNYLELASSEVLGYAAIPDKYMNEINTICQNGVTIWHDHNLIGNYSVDNTTK